MNNETRLPLDDPVESKLHPKWGYRLDRVKDVRCFYCGDPIGEEAYVEITIVARFGQRMFAHVHCEESGSGKE